MSNNDWNGSDDKPRGGADGWVDEEQQQRPPQTAQEPRNAGPQMEGVRQDSQGDLARRPQQQPSQTGSDSEDGKMLAILSHLSILFGIPIFLIPLIQRENAFALHHAKAAAVTYGMLMIAGMLSVVTCGLGVPLIFLCYVPAIIGIVKATNEELAGKWGMGDFGEQLLSSVQVKNDNQ